MNRLTLAVAGGRKTQSIVDSCVSAASGSRILVLTYTQNNQQEIAARISKQRSLAASVEVQGWFSFLLGCWVRPYVPMLFANRRLHGFNFEGDPGMYATGEARFFDTDGRAYKRHVGRLAIEVNAASSGAALDRLSRMYTDVYVDEVQDLNGYDLEVLLALMNSPINLHMVGDVRQALLATNIQDPKNKQFRGANIKSWFDALASKDLLTITTESTTWRSNQLIADFSDRIFDDSWGFALTTSMNREDTGHDGVFAVATEHVDAYFSQFNPLCLRHSATSATHLELPFMNFGVAKGLSVDRVLIAPTGPMVNFLRGRGKLVDGAACGLYVASTRARSSVAFVHDKPEDLGLQAWTP